MTVWVSGSGCWSGHVAVWTATRPCATRWPGPTTFSMTPKRLLLDRCSVFAGVFDLQSACAVSGFDDVDDFAVLDLLDALVRKSLLIADRSSGRTGFRCWRPFASSPRNNSSPAVKLTHGAYCACPTLRRARKRHPCALGQPTSARGLHLVHHGVGESAHRLPVGRRPRRPRRGRPHRHIRGIPREGSKATSRSPGPKNSSSPPAPPTTPPRGPVCDGVAVLPGRTARGRASVTATPARRW